MNRATVNANSANHDSISRMRWNVMPAGYSVASIHGDAAALHIFCDQAVPAANFNDLFKRQSRQTMLVNDRIPKHLIEDRLPERVDAVEGAGAEATQRVRLIEDRRNAFLLLQGW